MSFGLALLSSRGSRSGAAILPQAPIAVGDTRDIAAGETSVIVNVLASDVNSGGAVVTIVDGPAGADADVGGDQRITVTRIGTAAGSYSLTYRATTSAGFSDAILSGVIEAASVAPTAVSDARNLSETELSALVDVLANDSDVAGATVTIPTAATGAMATVELDKRIRVERIGTGSGNYSLTYRATTSGGFDEATLSGSIAAYLETDIPFRAGTTTSPGPVIEFRAGTTASPGAIIPFRAGTS
jgi:hypothetical protein